MHIIEKTIGNFDIEIFHFYSESRHRRRREHLNKFLFAAVITFFSLYETLESFSFVYFSTIFCEIKYFNKSPPIGLFE